GAFAGYGRSVQHARVRGGCIRPCAMQCGAHVVHHQITNAPVIQIGEVLDRRTGRAA
ncbi:MAG: hypothetical protein QOK44_2230, partial [Betaproteobacteria bacterium]|nr:hypothetical protein [Betaproteobacteria bacterium]